MDDNKKTYSLTEVANIMGISRATVYRLTRYGALLAFKSGSRWEITEDELIRFLKAGKMPPKYTTRSQPPKRSDRA